MLVAQDAQESDEVETKPPVIKLFRGEPDDIQGFTKTKVSKFEDSKHARDTSFTNSNLYYHTKNFDALDKELIFQRARELKLEQMVKFYPNIPKIVLKNFVNEARKVMP
ncbi:hypothetical protein N9B72_00825 [Bacteriovoracaceae bacterium]|nr:hypothetical protein [Bacteriovoracaceae bacterium]